MHQKKACILEIYWFF